MSCGFLIFRTGNGTGNNRSADLMKLENGKAHP